MGAVPADFSANPTGTQIEATVPPGAISGKVTVTSVGGLSAVSSATLGVPPTLDPLADTDGVAGEVLLLAGDVFTGTTSVKFKGADGKQSATAAFQVLSRTSLRVTVPTSAVTGPIQVTNAGGPTPSGVFTVHPKVTTLSPVSTTVGSTITLSGAAFEAPASTLVAFAGSAAPVHPSSVTGGTSLKVAVPTGAISGPVQVTTDGGGAAPTAPLLKVLPKFATPSVRARASAEVDGPFEIHGSGFNDPAVTATLGSGATAIALDGVSNADGTVITAHVPAGALSAKVTVTTAGGAATSASNLGVRPTIDDLGAASATAGDVIVLDGDVFTGTTSAKFAGSDTLQSASAVFKVLDRTHLQLTVPAGAVSGHVAVTNAGGTTVSTDVLTVHPKAGTISPTTATVGSTITLTGSGLEGPAGTTVAFAGSAAPVHPASVTGGTSLKVVVPNGAITGTVSVTTGGGTAATAGQLKVLPKFGSPAFAPLSAEVGGAFEIHGSGFNDPALTVKVGTAADAGATANADGTVVTAHVPAGATTAKVTVTTSGGSAISSTNFGVRPTIGSSFSPAHALTGDTITIPGSTFGGTSAVKFTSAAGGPPSVSATFHLVGATLTAVVPTAAATGPISVQNSGGTT